MRTRPSSSSTSIYTYLKAGMVFAATTATYFFARATGVLPSWFNWEKSSDVTPYSTDLQSELPASALLQFTEANLSTSLMSPISVTNPIPDQVIQVGQSYSHSLNQVFSPDYLLLSATETGQNSLPSWLTLQYQLIGTYFVQAGSAVQFVVISGNTAFVARQDLLILDISTPGNPLVMTMYSMPSGDSVQNLVVIDDKAFVAASNALLILDIAIPSSPTLLSTYPAGAGATILDVAVSGDIALVAERYGSGLLILNITNSSAPVFLSAYPAVNNTINSGYIASIAVSGSTAYLADWVAGLVIIDVSIPSNPRRLSSYLVYNPNSVSISDHQVFLMAFSAGLNIFDVSNSSHPVLLSVYRSPAGLTSFNAIPVGNLLLVADGTNGLQILNISQPTRPLLLGNYPASQNGIVYGAAMVGNTVFIAASSGGLQIIQLNGASLVGVPPLSAAAQRYSISVTARNETSVLNTDIFTLTLDQLPTLIQNTLLDQSVFPGQTMSLLIASELLFTNPGGNFLKLSTQVNGQLNPSWLDLTLAPVILSNTLSLIGSIEDIAELNGIVYVSGGSGLVILDATTPNNPHWRGSYLPVQGAGASRLTVLNSTVFMAFAGDGLLLINVNNLDHPVLSGNFTPGGQSDMTSLALFDSGTKVILTDMRIGLWILDVSNPSVPRLLSNYSIQATGGSGIQDVVIAGNTAFVSVDGEGLFIFNISDPTHLVLISKTSNSAGSLGINQQNLFVVNGGRLQIFDVSNVTRPVLIGYYNPFPGTLWGFTIIGTTLFIADGTAGLEIGDVAIPANPRRIGILPVSSGLINAVTVSGNFAFVSTSYNLQIADVSQWQLIATPNVTDVGNYNIQLAATDVFGGAATDTFIIRVEGPPQFHKLIPSQYAKVGQLFNYFIPQGLVTDPNFDSISFNATLQNGGSLPAWLKFNGFSAAFAGIPQGTDTGNFTIVLSATDNIAGTVNTTFGLLVVYTPVLNQPLINQVVEIGSPYQWTVPQNTFLNPNGGVLIYSAQWSGQTALPAWLNFNKTARQFYGTPGAADKNQYQLSVTAVDAYGGQVNAAYTLVVEYFPYANQSILAQVAGVGIPFTFSVTSDAFSAEDPPTLTYSASQTDQALLPNWLSFNPAIRTFSGVPQATDVGMFSVQVIATDSNGASAQQNFNVTVKSFPKVVASIPSQLAGVGSPFSFTISNAVFVNPKQGPLFYGIKQANGAALPGWLQFNNISLQLSGTANSSDAGLYDLNVLADDGEGAQVIAPLSLLVEYFPRVNQSIPLLIAQVGKPFLFITPIDTFIDPEGDTLTYQAGGMNGNPLPSWLSFSPQTAIFSGVPQVTDLGILPLQLTATDSHGASVSENFNVTVKYFPKVATPIPSQVADVGSFFNVVIANTTFVDLDNSVLLYSATQSGGSALPGWLRFNNKTLQFSGTPGEADVGSYGLAVICQEADDAQAQATADFSLLVEHFPTLNRPVTPQLVGVGQPYVLTLPADTFIDLDNHVLLYSAELADGAPLPNWLSFNSQTLVFSGVPQPTDLGLSTIQLLAVDSAGGQAEQIFNLTVIYIPQAGAPIAPQLAEIGQSYQFTLSADAFSNPGNEKLVYSASQQDGVALPPWLTFNASRQQFSGVPNSTDAGDYSLAVTAVDPLGLSAVALFQLLVENFPRLNQPIIPLLAGINLPFTFNLPYNTFSDSEGDVMTYQVMRADGSALPNWLSFNRQSLTFSGVPLETDDGALMLQLIATDPVGGYGKTNFTIEVVHYPAVIETIPTPPIARENRFFSFSIPAGTFSDPDEPQLLYNATQTSGQPLPSWLHFDAQALMFSGTPSSEDVGTLDMIVIGEDSRHLQAQAPVQLVIAANMPPVVKELISDQSATVGEFFNFYVPVNAIVDPDGDNLTYTAAQTGGQSLPEWLHFDAQTLNFAGTPGRGDTNTYAVRALGIMLSASDDFNHVSTSFTINVGGTSYLALAINVGLPLLSGLITLLEIYKKRALCLNHCNQKRYQKLRQTAEIGGGFSYPLETPPERVHQVKAQLLQPRQGCCRFFKSSQRHLSGEAHLPAWLEYDTDRNVLYTPGVIPATAPPELMIQVKDRSGILQEEFKLMITPATHHSHSEQFEDPVMPHLEEGREETAVELRTLAFTS